MRRLRLSDAVVVLRLPLLSPLLSLSPLLMLPLLLPPLLPSNAAQHQQAAMPCARPSRLLRATLASLCHVKRRVLTAGAVFTYLGVIRTVVHTRSDQGCVQLAVASRCSSSHASKPVRLSDRCSLH